MKTPIRFIVFLTISFFFLVQFETIAQSITGNNTVCENTTEIYNTTGGGSVASWIVNGGNITNGGTPADDFVEVLWDLGPGPATIDVSWDGGSLIAPTFNVQVNPAPIGGNDSPVICSGDNLNYNLQGNLNTFGNSVSSTFTWTAVYSLLNGGAGSGTGNIFEILSTSSASPGTATYTVTPTSLDGCTGNTFTITVTVNPLPSAAFAGSDQANCGLAAVMSGTTPVVGTGTWTQVGGPGTATISNPNNPATSVTVSSYGSYVLRWTVSDVCGSNFDEVIIDFYQQPVANAGSDGLGCNLTFTLGAIASVGTGIWTKLSGPGSESFTNANNPNSDVSVSTPGSYIFRWTETNGTCSSLDDVFVEMSLSPQGGNESPNICSGNTFFYNLQTNLNVLGNSVSSTFALSAVSYNGATGSVNYSPGPITDINEVLTNTTSNPISVIYTIVPTSLDGCVGTSFNVTANVYPIPDVSIINDTPSINSGESTSITLSNPNSVPGTTLNWNVSAPLISGASPGSGSIISQTLTNTSGSTQIAQYTVTPIANGCAGNPSVTNVSVSTDPGGILPTDYNALVDLYNSTNGAGWTNSTNWLSGSPSTWHGVTVTGNRVTGLNLNSNNLVGTLPSKLGDLTALTTLQLNTNSLTGSIPTTIGNLTSLVTLDLYSNGLSGSIPTEIGSLTALTYLDLGSNQLSGAVPIQIANLTALNLLFLDTNQFDNLPTLSALTSLTTLWVQNNKLEFDDLEPNISIPGFTYSPQQPSIVRNPQNFELQIGDPLTISSSIPGINNLFQWLKDGVSISGATSKNFSIGSVVGTDAGQYELSVTNSVVTGLSISYVYNVDIRVETLFTWVTSGPVVTDGANEANYTGAWGDFDNDGDEDLVVGYSSFGSVGSPFFYENNGDGSFTKNTTNAIATYTGYTRFSTWGDGNNDGNLDLLIGGDQVSVFTNQGGGLFNKVLYPNGSGGGNIFGDYDNDGKLDILFAESGNIKIENANGPVVDLGPSNNIGATHFVDFDNDNDLDVFQGGAGNGNGVRRLFQNNGNGTFTELTTNIIAQAPLGNRGGAWFDFDNDGDLDLFSSNQGLVTNGRIFVNNGGTNFISKTFAEVLGEDISSRGSTFGDIDNDGDQDFIAFRSSSSDAPSIYLNNGNATFSLVPSSTQTFKGTDTFAGFSMADYDNNGFLDLFIGNIQTAESFDGRGNGLYQNVGNSNHWLKIKLKGVTSNRSGIGARVRAYSGGKLQYRQLTPLSGWASPSSLTLHLGLGTNTTVDSIRVFWPSGVQQVVKNIAADAVLNVTESSPDSLALVALYNATNGANWTNKTNWLTGPVSSWFGVTIRQNRVAKLQMYSNNITGPLPAAIGSLTELDSLILAGNKLSGTLPAELGKLTKVLFIDLGGNQFTGSLPASLFTLTQLKTFGFAGNQLSGTIPPAVGNLVNLESFWIDRNNFSGAIPSEINNLANVKNFYLQDNQFTFVPPLALPALLGGSIQNNFLQFNSLQPNSAVANLQISPQKNIPAGSNIDVTLGSPLNLSVVVGGSGNVYQWKKFGNTISGATTSSFSISNATIADAGNYYLEITNPGAPSLTLRTTDFVVQVKSPLASEYPGYQFWKKLGAEALGIAQVKPGGRVNIDNLGNYYYCFASTNSSEIQKVSPTGNLLYTVNSGNQDIGGTDIAIDAANSIYVPGSNYATLKKYNSSGTQVFETVTYAGNRPFQALDFDPLDGSILAMDLQGGTTNRINRFNSSTGSLLGQISLTGGPVGFYGNVFDFDLDASRNIYVPDQTRIDKFSPTGVFISSIDVSMLNSWGGVILQVASNGHVYAANWFVGNIFHFDENGVLLDNFGYENYGFASLTISPSDELIASISGVAIVRFDLNGNFLGFAEPRNANGQFNSATDVAIDSKGFRYVADKYNHRIQKLNAQGNWVANFGTFGTSNGQFDKPVSAAIDALDNVYVVDNGNNRVQKFSSSGTHLLTIGSAGSGNGQFTNPVAIVVSNAGNILVADKGNSRVQIFQSDGTFVSAFGTAGTGQGQFTNLQDLSSEADGTILAADGQVRLQRFTSAGAFVSELNMFGPVTSIPAFSTDVEGFLYIPTGGIVKKFDKDGGHITDIGLAPTASLADGELRSVAVSTNLAGDTLWIADNSTTNRVSIFTANFTSVTSADSLALVDLYNSTSGASWAIKTNWLSGSIDTWYGVTVTNTKITSIDLSGNNLNGSLPASIASLNELTSLNVSGNKITDPLPTLPPNLVTVNLANNALSQLGNLSTESIVTLKVENNKLTFEDLEPNVGIATFTYSPQDSVGTLQDVLLDIGQPLVFKDSVGGNNVQYQWKKNGVAIPGATSYLYSIPSVQFSNEGVHRMEATSALVPGLTITGRNKKLRASSLKRDSIALRTLYDSTAGPGWVLDSNWLSAPIGSGTWYGVTVLNNRVTSVDLSDNNLVGKVPSQFTNLKEVITVDLSGNKLTGLSNITTLPLVTSFKLENNQLDFGDLELNAGTTGLSYAPQDSVSSFESVLKQIASSQTFTSAIAGTANQYQWKKDGTNLAGATSKDLTISNITFNEDGIYSFEATSPLVPGLTLTSAKKVLRVSSLERDQLALTKFFNDTGGPDPDGWIRKDNWVVTPLATGNWFGVTITNNRVTNVSLPNNNIKGALTASIADVENLVTLDLSNNLIEQMPNLTTLPNIVSFDISGNKLDFGSLIANSVITGIDYSDQADLGEPRSDSVAYATDFKVKIITRGEGNRYQWKRNGVNVTNATDSTYVIPAINRSNMGDYLVEITNPAVPNLVLKSSNWRVLATATLSGLLRETETDPVTVGKVTLFKINTTGKYDTTKIQKVNTSGEFKLEKVVLDDYLLLAEADTNTYRTDLPTWYKGTLYWEEADTLFVNEDQTDLNILIKKKPTTQPKGQGEITGVFEDTNVDDGGKTLANKRIANAGVSIRRKTNTGRPQEEVLDLIAYIFTDEQGTFKFENLEQGDYLLNLQYPGYPMDPNSFINIQIGTGLAKSVEVKALVQDGKIVVKKIVITGWDEEDNRFRVYPNPASGEFTIDVRQSFNDLSYSIVNTLGQLQETGNLPSIGSKAINIENLTPGVYQVIVEQPQNILKSFRIVVSKK